MMKLLFAIAGIFFSTSTKQNGADDCASKLNEAFVGNERYWSLSA